MGPGRSLGARAARHGWLYDLLTFERMITGPVIHLVYWAGLGVLVIASFGVVGASVGIAIRDRNLVTILGAVASIVAGLLIVVSGGVVWRAFCEFYVVIFRIGDDLSALRRAAEAEQAGQGAPRL